MKTIHIYHDGVLMAYSEAKPDDKHFIELAMPADYNKCLRHWQKAFMGIVKEPELGMAKTTDNHGFDDYPKKAFKDGYTTSNWEWSEEEPISNLNFLQKWQVWNKKRESGEV